jgi:HSP20 family protein
MGQGRIFDYKKFLKEFEELRFREGRLYAERVTAIYGGGATSTGEWTPAVDVFETTDFLYLVAELAGVAHEDIEVTARGNIVTLRGVRPFSGRTVSSENFFRMEFSYGTFDRSFVLPCDVEESQMQVFMEDGVLTVKLPRCASACGPEGEGGADT